MTNKFTFSQLVSSLCFTDTAHVEAALVTMETLFKRKQKTLIILEESSY